METPVEQAVYRIRKLYRRADKPKGYEHTLELIDDHSRQVLAAP